MRRLLSLLTVLTAVAVIAAGCSSGAELSVVEPVEGAPVGELLLQQRRDDGVAEMVRFELATGRTDRLTPDGASGVAGVWSADGSHVAYGEQREGDPNVSIQVMTPDGTPTSTVASGGVATFPTWSPDCRRIAFIEIDLAQARSQLVVASVDGSDRQEIWSGPGISAAPAWSPTADRIVFQSRSDGDSEIVAIDADGRNAVALTDNGADDSGPSWSPDGQRIVFATGNSASQDLVIVDRDGRNSIEFTTAGSGGQFPTWSPDGAWIAFESLGGGLSLAAVDGQERIDLKLEGQPTDWGPKTGLCS